MYTMKIGFIGQGYVGKNTADDFESRGFEVIRYSLEQPYIENKDKIADCDIVFVAVPTPSTPEGFDYHLVHDLIALVGAGKIVVIKSTILPGTTKKIQEAYPDRIVLFSPEFLCESTAAYDVAHPILNVIGLPNMNDTTKAAGKSVMDILSPAPYTHMVQAESAELFKYVHNLQGYMRVVLSNLFYDVADTLALNWDEIRPMMDQDPMMSAYYNMPIHKSGRGAGGHCFIKDMAAFRGFYEKMLPHDVEGAHVFRALEKKNLALLNTTNKDQDLVSGVYGEKKSL